MCAYPQQSETGTSTAMKKRSFENTFPRGEWPADPGKLPVLITQYQLAHLRGVCVRVLQKERAEGRGVPYTKEGSRVWYARDRVLAHYGAA